MTPSLVIALSVLALLLIILLHKVGKTLWITQSLKKEISDTQKWNARYHQEMKDIRMLDFYGYQTFERGHPTVLFFRVDKAKLSDQTISRQSANHVDYLLTFVVPGKSGLLTLISEKQLNLHQYYTLVVSVSFGEAKIFSAQEM